MILKKFEGSYTFCSDKENLIGAQSAKRSQSFQSGSTKKCFLFISLTIADQTAANYVNAKKLMKSKFLNLE